MVASGKAKLTRYQQGKQQKCVLRTLENLPMKYDSDDSRSLATSYRSIRSAKMDDAKWASHVSRNQLTQSKRLFEDCLSKQSQEEKCDKPMNSSRSTVSRLSIHSGPTPYGSPLYQNLWMSGTPPRVPVEAPPEYFRAKSPIEDKLKRSNSAFRVAPRTSSKPSLAKSLPSFPDYLLVPNSEGSQLESRIPEGRPSIKPVHIMARRPYDVKISSLYPEQTVTMRGERKISFNEDKSTVHSKSATGPSKFPDKAEETRDKTKDTQLAVNHDGSRANSVKSSSTKDRQNIPNGSAKGSQESKVASQKAKSKKITDKSSDITVIQGPILPTYICPSSEEKSREARIRHWLCDSTFTCADRQVPLVF